MADQVEGVHLEAPLLADLAETLDVAAAALAEVEILSHDDGFGVKRIEKDLLDEDLGMGGRPVLIELDHVGVVDAVVGDQLELLVESGEKARRALRTNDVGRMPVERDHSR